MKNSSRYRKLNWKTYWITYSLGMLWSLVQTWFIVSKIKKLKN